MNDRFCMDFASHIWLFFVNFSSSLRSSILMHAPDYAQLSHPKSKNNSKYVVHCMFSAKYSTIGIHRYFLIVLHNHITISNVSPCVYLSPLSYHKTFGSNVAHNVVHGTYHHECRGLSLSLMFSYLCRFMVDYYMWYVPLI